MWRSEPPIGNRSLTKLLQELFTLKFNMKLRPVKIMKRQHVIFGINWELSCKKCDNQSHHMATSFWQNFNGSYFPQNSYLCKDSTFFCARKLIIRLPNVNGKTQNLDTKVPNLAFCTQLISDKTKVKLFVWLFKDIWE